MRAVHLLFKMWSLFAVCALIAGCSASPWGRIVNGTNAREGEIPYIVSLRYFDSHTCGGSILDETHVLTASHCVYGRTSSPSLFSIQYGVLRITSDRNNVVGVSKITMHPKYISGGSYNNDIAVLTLSGKINLGGNVAPTKLPAQGAPVPGNQGAVLAGWGYPFTGGSVMRDLQRVDIKVYTPQDCSNAHGGRTDPNYHVCAGVPEGGKGQCSGDSGGPLNVNGVQYGVVSWSVKPCTIKGYPGVFANVAQYVDWVKEQMRS